MISLRMSSPLAHSLWHFLHGLADETQGVDRTARPLWCHQRILQILRLSWGGRKYESLQPSVIPDDFILFHNSSKGSRWLMWFQIQWNYWMRMRLALPWTFCCQNQNLGASGLVSCADRIFATANQSVVGNYWHLQQLHSYERNFLDIPNLCFICSHSPACRTGWLQAKAGLEGIRGRGLWSVGAGSHQRDCAGQQQHALEDDRLCVYYIQISNIDIVYEYTLFIHIHVAHAQMHVFIFYP